MATGSPWGLIRNAMEADREIRIRDIRIFRNFFFAFFASMDLLGPQGHPLDGPESPNPDREIRFSKIQIFRFFDFLSLKTLQHGCLLTQGDQLKSSILI